MADTLAAIERAIATGRYTQHMAINAAKLVAMHDDPKLCEIVDGCGLVSADGQSVVWASRLLGDPLPERVAGIDLMDALLELAERRGYRVYFLGARAEVLDARSSDSSERYPGSRSRARATATSPTTRSRGGVRGDPREPRGHPVRRDEQPTQGVLPRASTGRTSARRS